MKQTFLMGTILCAATIIIPVVQADLPGKGMLQSKVVAAYGEPRDKEPTVGQPPITRWIYDDFSVVFEYDHVVHAYNRLETLEGQAIQAIPRRRVTLNAQSSHRRSGGDTVVMPVPRPSMPTQPASATTTAALEPVRTPAPVSAASANTASANAAPMSTPETTPPPLNQPRRPERATLPTPDNTFPGERRDDAVEVPGSLDPTFFNPDDYR